MDIRIGTSGYSYDDWRGIYYPPELPRGGMLGWYAGVTTQSDLLAERGPSFDTVEINVTYHRLPSAKSFARMTAVTPAGFLFSVKAPSGITHPGDYKKLDSDLVERYCASVFPLAEAGKLGPTLLQFPYRFKAGEETLDYLRAVAAEFDGLNPAVEFRHRSWINPEYLTIMVDLGLTFVSVDMPELRGLPPPILFTTTDTIYVRFHGRRRGTWWRGSNLERYDYEYAEEELEAWSDRIRSLTDNPNQSDEETRFEFDLDGDYTDLLKMIRRLAGPVKRAFLFFNNHPKGKAIHAARSLQQSLLA